MKKRELFTVIGFCGFLAAMTVCYLLLPKREFSETEKRYLADAPALTWEAVASGDWGSDAETYMADHIPGRDFLVGLNAYFDLITGRQGTKDVRLYEGRLLEAPVERDEKAIEKNMKAINAFAGTLDRPVDLMIVPSAGWAAELEGYSDSEIIAAICAEAGDKVTPVRVEELFAGRPWLYYNTDHHWTSAGAWRAYRAYMEALGREYRQEEDYIIEVFPGFRGSTYSRSALWLTPGEDLELWHGSEDLAVTNGESEGSHDGVFYRERLEEADMYTVFLDGNHSLVRIQNPGAEGKLLVIRDSYSNSLGCFLAESYAEVVLVDLRYYRQPVSQLAAEEKFDDILVCYSIGNFLTDTNLVWLR
nr:hypothetical protein [Oscillospiraceae bacterium]